MLVLLVDDDESELEVFCDIVKSIDASIDCIAVTDAEQGLKILKDELSVIPDFIFLDIKNAGNEWRCLS